MVNLFFPFTFRVDVSQRHLCRGKSSHNLIGSYQTDAVDSFRRSCAATGPKKHVGLSALCERGFSLKAVHLIRRLRERLEQ